MYDQQEYAAKTQPYAGLDNEPNRAPAVLVELSTLEKHLHVLSELTAKLEERLERAMQPEGPARTNSLPRDDGGPKPMQCPLAHQVALIGNLAETSVGRVQAILRRLEL